VSRRKISIMVTNLIFFTKSFDPFKKWTKKMSKIEKTKKLLDKKIKLI